MFTDGMHVNATSVWASARESVQCFEDLSTKAEGLGKEGATFIFTGNLFNDTVSPGFLPFGMGKSATAHLVQYLALIAYSEKPYKYIYSLSYVIEGIG